MRVSVLLLCALLAGCGKSGAGSSASSGEGGTSGKSSGKVFTSSKKGGSAAQQTPQMDADTTDRRGSTASDDGAVSASKNLPVVNPGAPAASPPPPH